MLTSARLACLRRRPHRRGRLSLPRWSLVALRSAPIFAISWSLSALLRSRRPGLMLGHVLLR
eukprot:2924368-Pyramimonas_sp.AAC.1